MFEQISLLKDLASYKCDLYEIAVQLFVFEGGNYFAVAAYSVERNLRI